MGKNPNIVPSVTPDPDFRAVEIGQVPKDDQHITITRAELKAAMKLLPTWTKANVAYAKAQEAQNEARGSLSSVMWELAKQAADHCGEEQQYRVAAFDALCDAIEAQAKLDYCEHKKLPPGECSLRDALGATWQTYRSTSRGVLRAGYDPRKFTSGKYFREAVTNSRKARQGAGPAGKDAGEAVSKAQGVTADQAWSSNVTATMQIPVAQALLQLYAELKRIKADDAMKAADAISTATATIFALNEAHKVPGAKRPRRGESATAVM
jgi:hypothetical protein